MSLNGVDRLITAHTAVTDAVSHGTKLKSSRYFVWQEEGSNDLIADDIHAERATTGTTDLFTRMEFDPWKDAFEKSLDDHGICWGLESIQFEPDTGYWHYEWTWEV